MSEIPDIDTEAAAFRAVLGDELRQVRKRRGWTRQDLVDRLQRLQVNISTNTLACYEFGTHAMSVSLLFPLCRALEIQPGPVLDRVWRRVLGSNTFAYVDLVKLARTTVERLQPLRPWAQLRVDELPDGEQAGIPFTADALDSMAWLCGMDRAGLVRALVQGGIARPWDRNGGVDT